MNTGKRIFKKENEEIIDSYDYLANAASTQDCTGLIPANPLSQEALEAYEDVYNYGFPKQAMKNQK